MFNILDRYSFTKADNALTEKLSFFANNFSKNFKIFYNLQTII